jgi:sodium/bile acid cotransporter 7
MVLTPLLAGLLLQTHGGASLNGVGSIALCLLLPFLAGQVLQSKIDAWMQRHAQGGEAGRSRFGPADGL